MTTSGDSKPQAQAQARARAREWGLPYLARPHKAPLGPWLGKAAQSLLVFERGGLALWTRLGKARFHPGMAHLRLKRLDSGILDDRMLAATGLRERESVLDCTLGLAQDALVAARAVGPQGRVVGVEKSLPIYALVSEGLLGWKDPRSAPIRVLHAEALEVLRAQADRSFDCVLFDPMFGRPTRAQPSFELIRSLAAHDELTPELLEEARRVARRVVAVKGARYSRDFKKLSLTPLPAPRSADVLWAVVTPRPS